MQEERDARTERDSSTRKTILVSLRIATIKIVPFGRGLDLREYAYCTFSEVILDNGVATDV